MGSNCISSRSLLIFLLHSKKALLIRKYEKPGSFDTVLEGFLSVKPKRVTEFKHVKPAREVV